MEMNQYHVNKISDFMQLIKYVSFKSSKSFKYIEVHMDNTLQFDSTSKREELSRSNCHRLKWPYLKWGKIPSYLHKGHWREYMTCNNRKIILRVAKMILSYINKSNNSNTFGKETLIYSYWMKTILLYM